ncbi:hypothetical protein ACFQZ4_49580 [Catellatospora coxensis]
MGYPRLLEDTLECDLLFGDLDVDWLTETADLVAARMQDAVVEIKGSSRDCRSPSRTRSRTSAAPACAARTSRSTGS